MSAEYHGGKDECDIEGFDASAVANVVEHIDHGVAEEQHNKGAQSHHPCRSNRARQGKADYHISQDGQVVIPSTYFRHSDNNDESSKN